MANGFPLIPQGPFAPNPSSNIPSPVPLPSPVPIPGSLNFPSIPGTQPAPSGLFDEGGALDLRNNPSALMALLKFAGGVLQPAGPGGTSAGVFGKALAGAVDTFGQQKNSEAQQAATNRGLDISESKIAETARQDTEVNPVEQSLIDYRAALANAAGKGGGSNSEAAFKQLNRSEGINAIKQLNPNMNDAQATLQWELLQLTKGASVPSVAASDVLSGAAESGSFGLDEALAGSAAVAAQPGVSLEQPAGTKVTPEEQKALEGMTVEQMEKIEGDEKARANVIKKFGEAAWNAAVVKLMRESKSK